MQEIYKLVRHSYTVKREKIGIGGRQCENDDGTFIQEYATEDEAMKALWSLPPEYHEPSQCLTEYRVQVFGINDEGEEEFFEDNSIWDIDYIEEYGFLYMPLWYGKSDYTPVIENMGFYKQDILDINALLKIRGENFYIISNLVEVIEEIAKGLFVLEYQKQGGNMEEEYEEGECPFYAPWTHIDWWGWKNFLNDYGWTMKEAVSKYIEINRKYWEK